MFTDEVLMDNLCTQYGLLWVMGLKDWSGGTDPVSVNQQTAAGAGGLWRRQLWAEPRASGGIHILSQGAHRVYFITFLRPKRGFNSCE